jgi:hypothetical protein
MTDKRFFLDRVENDIAVLVPEGGEEHLDISCDKLPKDAREGVWLIQRTENGEYEIDEAQTKSVKDDVQSLMDEMAG